MYSKLDETFPKIKQPKKMKTPLKTHQLTSVACMKSLEKKGKFNITDEETIQDILDSRPRTTGYRQTIQAEELVLETNVGILADSVGSGKTFIIYGLLTSSTRPPMRDYTLYGSNHISVIVKNKIEPIRTNLIVVPHNLVDQWAQVGKLTHLSMITLSTLSDFDIFFDMDIIDANHDLVKFRKLSNGKFTIVDGNLVTVHHIRGVYTRKILNMGIVNAILETTRVIILNIKRYDVFHRIFQNILWARVIIDEIVSISLPTIFNEKGSFNWYITATPEAIRRNTSYRYLASVYGSGAMVIPNFYIKNTDEYIKRSIILPAPFVYMVVTKLPVGVGALVDLIPEEAIGLINAGDLKGAIKKLNCDVDTEDNIFQALTNSYNAQIEKKNAELEYVSRVPAAPGKAKIKQDKLSSIRDTIGSLEYKVKLIAKRIKSINTECCFICADDFKTPAILECCNNVFCLECLCMSLKQSGSKCPYCQTIVTRNMYHVVVDKKIEDKPKEVSEEPTEYSKLSKLVVIEKILEYISANNEKPRIIIFSDHNKTFDNMITIFAKLELQYARLAGTPAHITKTINRYNAGEINVIMMQSTNYGSGLNLHHTDFVILYHRMSESMETQVIGRAHRQGREGNLKIIYLVDSNERDYTDMTARPMKISNDDNLEYIQSPGKYPDTDPVAVNYDDDSDDDSESESESENSESSDSDNSITTDNNIETVDKTVDKIVDEIVDEKYNSNKYISSDEISVDFSEFDDLRKKHEKAMASISDDFDLLESVKKKCNAAMARKSNI